MNAPSLRHRLAEQDRVELRAQRGAVGLVIRNSLNGVLVKVITA